MRSHPANRPPGRTAPRRRACSGMTMSEVLIAAVLLAFVVMTSLTALSQAYGFTRHARLVTLAGQIVQSVMEDLRLRNYSALSGYAADPTTYTPTIAGENFSSSFTSVFSLSKSFTVLQASTTNAGGTQLGKLSATITVSWTENTSTYSRSLTTYFSEKGLSDYYYVGWAP